MNKVIWKKVHNVFGLTSAVFLLLLLGTGILLNHPERIQREEVRIVVRHPFDSAQMVLAKPDGLFRSQDGGGSWEEVPMLYPPRETVDLVFAPQDARQLFLLEKWGRLLASGDGGKTWRNVELPFDPQAEGIEMKRLSAGPQSALVLLTSHGWLSSRDGGRHWETSHFDPRARPLARLILSLHNGHFFGPRFVWVYDFAAVALLMLVLTGLYLWKIGRSTGS